MNVTLELMPRALVNWRSFPDSAPWPPAMTSLASGTRGNSSAMMYRASSGILGSMGRPSHSSVRLERGGVGTGAEAACLTGF